MGLNTRHVQTQPEPPRKGIKRTIPARRQLHLICLHQDPQKVSSSDIWEDIKRKKKNCHHLSCQRKTLCLSVIVALMSYPDRFSTKNDSYFWFISLFFSSSDTPRPSLSVSRRVNPTNDLRKRVGVLLRVTSWLLSLMADARHAVTLC